MAKKSIFDEIEGEIAEEVAENAESGAQVANEPDESQAGPDKEEKIGEGAPAAGASPEDPSDEVSDSQVEDYLYGKKGKKKGGKKRRFFNEGDDPDDGGDNADDGDDNGDDAGDDDGDNGDDDDDADDDTPAGDDCRNRKGKKGKGKKKSHPKNIFDEIEGELSEEVADDPENASAIDEPDENDVKPDEAGDDRPNAGSDEAGTTPEEPSEEVSDSQIEDYLTNGCSGGKKKSKKRKGVRNEDDADGDDDGDDNPENPDDADNQASEEHPDDDDPDNEGDDDGDDDDEGASEDKKKKGKKKSKKGLTNWEAWRAELEEADPTIPEGTDGDRPDGFEQQDDEAKPNTPPELTEPIQKETETSQDDQPEQDPDDLERVPDAEIQNLLHRGW